MFTPHEPPPRARDIGRIPFPRLTPWAGPGGQDSMQLATPSPLQISTPITPGQPVQQGADAKAARQRSLPQTKETLVMWSSKTSSRSGHNQGKASPTLESLPRPSTALQRSREEKPRQEQGQWGAAQKQTAEVWSPGLPRVARADPALTKLPASKGSASAWPSLLPEGRRLDLGDKLKASREEHPKVLKDEHTPKTLSRLSRPSGVTEASLEASAGAAQDAPQPRVIESPRFSVLRAHLQGLVLGKPGQDGASSSNGGARGAAWRPMQSSVPRPQRPAGSGRLQVQSPASGLTAVSSPASAAPAEKGPPSQCDSVGSALLNEASRLAAEPSGGQVQKHRSAQIHSSTGPAVSTSPATSSAAKRSSPPSRGNNWLSGDGLASSSSADKAVQHQEGGRRWRAEDLGLHRGLGTAASRGQPSHLSGAIKAEEGRQKMDEMLASMHDLTGSHVLPILAAHVHALPQAMPRPQHDSAAGATVSEQLANLKALQQEGAQAFSDNKSPGARRKAASSTGQLPRDSTRAALPQSTTSFGQVTTSGRKGRKGHETTHRKERILPLNTDGDASGRGSRVLLSQLQRLQALQQEAQSLLT